MRKSIRAFSLAFAALVVASGVAQAQGKGQGKGGDHAKGKGKSEAVVRGNVDTRGNVHAVQPQRTGTGRGTGYGVGGTPPGLAKKPGGMPPGQYKKYTPDQGVGILRDILNRHGYRIVRTSSSGDRRYVYYRATDGVLRRATVSPGTDRLNVSNVPNPIMRELLSKMR